MEITGTRPPVAPGEPAPNFVLPRVDRDEPVSLADYRGRAPVFLALLLGLWCPFCRRQIAQLGEMEGKLKKAGVESLGVVATAPENARMYFSFRPTRLPLAADPELTTHRAYGVPKPVLTDFMRALETVRVNPTENCRNRCRSSRRPKPSRSAMATWTTKLIAPIPSDSGLSSRGSS